jgi:hypothetical protein
VSEICTSVQEHRWIGKSNAEACQRINSGIEAFFTFFFLDKKESRRGKAPTAQTRMLARCHDSPPRRSQ